MRLLLAACLGLHLVSSTSVVEQDALTQSEVEDAIREGARMKPRDVGLVLKPQVSLKERLALEAVRALQNPLEERPKIWPGFAMVVHSPLSWIQLASARAALRFEHIKVTDDTKTPVLRIFLKPDSQTRAVVRSIDGRIVIQPTASKSCLEIMQFGNEASGDCVEAQFEFDAVRRLQDSRGEFLITVIIMGTAGEMTRDFRVKRGDLRKLPGLGAH